MYNKTHTGNETPALPGVPEENFMKIQNQEALLMADKIKKVVLAYSGGLDTSIIIP